MTRRIRALFTKTRAAKQRLDINEAIGEVVVLAGSEMRRNRVISQMELTADLPPVTGDRVQLQQVVLNLVLNGIEAMSTVEDYPRELVIRTQRSEMMMRCVLQYKTQESALIQEAGNESFRGFIRPNPTAWGWVCPSAVL